MTKTEIKENIKELIDSIQNKEQLSDLYEVLLAYIVHNRERITKTDSVKEQVRKYYAHKNQTDIQKLINIDKEIMSGTPVFMGTRVPVKTLFDHIGSGIPLEEFLIDFPSVKRSQALEVIQLSGKFLNSYGRLFENLLNIGKDEYDFWDDFTTEEQKEIELILKDAEQGKNLVSHEEVLKRISKCLKK